QILAPEMEIITPIRDQQLSRQEEVAFLNQHGFHQTWEKAAYSINQGLWGTSVGGKETLTSSEALPESAFPSQLQENTSTTISLTFNKGEVYALDGKVLSPINLIKQLNALGSRYAIGRDTHVGDTIIGIKGRVGFEAAGPMIIIKAHELLEKHTLSKWQSYWKQQLSNWYGMSLHEGQFFDPVLRNIESFLEESQKNVTGKVSITLHPYRFELKGITSEHDLMQAKFGTYGEMNKGWSAEEAKGFIKILANPHKIYHQVNQETISL
ncbi:MAG: argininosuccinate synthase, partial [Bacteroidota bacterium]